MIRIKLLLFSIFLLASELAAQKIHMEKIELLGSVIEVHYTLEDANENHEYLVDLYSSKDNFAEPLTKVSGDVGAEIKPGSSRIIKWEAFQEIGDYQGELSLEIRARVYIPFIKITGFSEGTKYKRGQAYPLLWESGNLGGQIDIELYRDQSRVGGDRNVPNSGKYEYAFPGSIKRGKEYRLKFTNTRNRDESTYTGYFIVVPKLPLVIKISAMAAVLAGVAILVNSSSSGGGGEASVPLLGDPPSFPDN
jgi:hypothetical protein